MHISWFRPEPRPTGAAVDGIGHLIARLAGQHDIRVVGPAAAHDELWRHRRGRTELAVYELTGSPGDAYMWPYLVRLPGLVLVLGRQAVSGHRSQLVRQGRREDADRERDFLRDAPEGALAIPLACARLVAVPDGLAADSLTEPSSSPVRTFTPAMERPALARQPRTHALRVGLVAPAEATALMAARAVERARAAGSPVSLVVSDDAEAVLAQADVLASVAWPPPGGVTGDVLAAQALGLPAIVMESPDTASLPCLDPQTWLPRDTGPGAPTPVAISLDPRDQEHSLVLAIRRLAGDAALAAALGEAGAARWARVHEPSVAAAGFAPVLEAAAAAPPPALPANWPAHFRADASGTARRILADAGLHVDIL